jgi:hypothetical protein
MSIAVLRQMFEQMVEKQDPTAIEQFYDPSFVMFSNGVTQDFEAFTASHRTVYSTEIRYSVEYDEDAWVETPDRVAGRVWITTSRPNERPHPHRGRVDRRIPRRTHHPGFTPIPA